jgi:drug/metabolite transporter (DMT)-like permease
MDTQSRDGMSFAMMTITAYAFLPVFTKWAYAYSTLQPFDISGWRFLGGVPLIWVMLWARGAMTHQSIFSEPIRPYLKFLGLGALLAIGALCIAYGLSYVDASLYIVLMRTQPAMVMALSAYFLGETIGWRGWVAFAMVAVGILFVQPDVFSLQLGRSEMIGVGIALFHAFVIAIYNLGQQQFSRTVPSKPHASAWTMTGTLAVLFPAWLLTAGFQAPTNLAGSLNVVGLVVICTVVPILTMYEAISRLGAARFSLVASVGPVLTILLAFLLLGERLMWVQAIGGFFILASVPVLELDPPGWLSRWIERRWPNGMWSKGQVGAAGD